MGRTFLALRDVGQEFAKAFEHDMRAVDGLALEVHVAEGCRIESGMTSQSCNPAASSSQLPTSSGIRLTCPGMRPSGNPTCPPSARLPQRHVAARPRAGRGRLAAGTNGSFSALSASAGNADAVQVRLGRCTRVVVVGIAKAVQRRGEDVVELVEIARGHAAGRIEQARVLRQLAQAPWASCCAGTWWCRPAG